MNFLVLSLIFLWVTPDNCFGDGEHKVHNIVLYPGKHSWCKTQAIKQIVATPGYEPVTIDNNVCVGTCYSYSIPRTQPAEPGELIGPYCDSCQPMETKCYHVTLKASENGTKTKQKRVEIITNCSCSSCDKVQSEDCEITDRNTSELPINLFAILTEEKNRKGSDDSEEIPELLNMEMEDHVKTTIVKDIKSFPKYEINSKIINLLKSIQNEDENSNISYDREELSKLLKILEGSEHELKDENLMDFVNFVNIYNSEDLELDLSRLKEALQKFQKKHELYEKHRNFGIGNIDLTKINDNNNAKIETDIREIETKYSVKNFGVNTHLIHHTAGVIDNNNEHHRHHLGEHQETEVHHIGHLIRGPHGSLVLTADENPIKIEEKLNIESEEIRPNQEGIVLSYDAHQPSQHTRHRKSLK